MKINIISVISVCIRSVFIPAYATGFPLYIELDAPVFSLASRRGTNQALLCAGLVSIR
jgi:hypothetical protein